MISLDDRSYETYVRDTSPVFQVPMQGAQPAEVVRGIQATWAATRPLIATGPFAGTHSYRFSAANDDDYFEIPTHTSYHPGTTDFSVGGWFNLIGEGQPFEQMINLSANDIGIGFGNTTDDRPGSGRTGVGDYWKATNAVIRGRWYHIIVTKIGGSTALGYINGAAEAGTYTAQTISATTNPVRFGLEGAGTNYDFDGQLAHWAIWRRVLTPGEVRGLYLAGVN